VLTSFFTVAFVRLSQADAVLFPLSVGHGKTLGDAIELARLRAYDCACGEHGGRYCTEAGHEIFVLETTERYWRWFSREPQALRCRADGVVASHSEIEAEDPDSVTEFAKTRDKMFSREVDGLFVELLASFSEEIATQQIELSIDGILSSEVLEPRAILTGDKLTGHQAMAVARLRGSAPEAFASRFIRGALQLECVRKSPVLEFYRQAVKNDEYLIGQVARIAARQTSSAEEAIDAGFVPLCQTMMRDEADDQFRRQYACFANF
jgi:hypothetical protein